MRAANGNGTIQIKGAGFLAKFPIGRRFNEKIGDYVTAYLTKTFDTKPEAQNWLLRNIQARENGHIAVGGERRFCDYAESVLCNGAVTIAPRSADHYYRNLKKHFFPSFGNKFLKDILPDELDLYFEEIQKTHSESVAIAIKTALGAVYKCAVKQGHVAANPLEQTKKRARTHSECYKCSLKSI